MSWSGFILNLKSVFFSGKLKLSSVADRDGNKEITFVWMAEQKIPSKSTLWLCPPRRKMLRKFFGSQNVGSAVRGEGGIWCVWRIPPFLHPLSAADPEVGTVVQIFKGFCHKELLLMNLIYIFLAVINKGLIWSRGRRHRLRKHNLKTRGQMVSFLWKSWFFFFLLFEKFCFTFQSSITLMDSFKCLNVAFDFLLPVFSLFFSWSKCKTPCLDSLRFDLVINLLILSSRLWIL